MSSTSPSFIRLRGVRQNNLKNLDLDLPLGRLVVVTGLSGSGKSSLVFETLHAEGQRRYVETFSPYTRQFLDLLDRPKVDSMENVPPSIAIEQTNTVRNSRSTVGTMTELCDFFKVWFSRVADLFDPETGEAIRDDNPASIWKTLTGGGRESGALIAFPVSRPANLTWEEILQNIQRQGYTRAVAEGRLIRIDKLDTSNLADGGLAVVQDRISLKPTYRSRFLEAAETALHYGQGSLIVFTPEGGEIARFSRGLRSPVTGRRFRPAQPALFSFNSPIGACPRCRGFGRVIEIDYNLAIPDRTLTLKDGAVAAWQGEVYSECQRDLGRFARKTGLPLDVPFQELTREERDFVVFGEPDYGKEGREWPDAWYGVKGFFDWLESKTYKMHVRIFLSKYRAYRTCPDCGGSRLQPESLLWKWKGHTLPGLYALPVAELLVLLRREALPAADRQIDVAFESLLARLGYLDQVGLGYLTLDRSSRTLSGGEVERVNLTACLGTSLVDTLFVLDEPSVGLHCRDIDRLIGILRRLTDQGNTVVVVEHDEAIMRAADQIIEIGPAPGSEGGRLVFQGTPAEILSSETSLTGAYLSGRRAIELPARRRPVGARHPRLRFNGVTKHNIRGIDAAIPLRRFVCLSGVSGSGKSTLLRHVIHDGLIRQLGGLAEDPAEIKSISCREWPDEVVLVDQSPLSRTPRSNPALYSGAWEEIRKLFAATPESQGSGYTASDFSFNAGAGRCETCKGLGHERVEMQFLSDVFVTCPQCEGKRFKPEILAIGWRDRSINEILELTVADALVHFHDQPRITAKLEPLRVLGLEYLTLGQPLTTLSGGESQRLKLVRFLPQLAAGTSASGRRNDAHALLLLDEPTTGLHRHDINRLIQALHRLVDEGHSLVVIEHQPDMLNSADWIVELGPDAGANGGLIVAEGPPETIAAASSPTAPFLLSAEKAVEATLPAAAEEGVVYGFPPSDEAVALAPGRNGKRSALEVAGAREHNLKNITVSIPHGQMTVLTGLSGSGKSTLAFDIIFAEVQRRFMESMSPYARQFVEQLPRPDIDRLTGIPPTVAIEQRITTGNRKSTVATVTEVAQYLRLLYARIGIQHSPVTGEPVAALSPAVLLEKLRGILQQKETRRLASLYLCSPVIRGRKGHHQPIADWLAKQGFEKMRVDGKVIAVEAFTKLNRYTEHDIEIVLADLRKGTPFFKTADKKPSLEFLLDEALRLGKGSCFLLQPDGGAAAWLSSTRTDPATGESFPELDPKHFSFNPPKGWCPSCRGYGRLHSFLFADDEDGGNGGLINREAAADTEEEGGICPDCQGDRLNRVSRSVKLHLKKSPPVTLPELLRHAPDGLLAALQNLKLDRRGKAITGDILPQIEERLRFLGDVGLDYLTLDRSALTLSGGEAQRIRLAAQLGSNLSGVLYVLDEPSIGLHAGDNHKLLQALSELSGKGNTLLVVEHDEETMRRADRIIDMGPGAGVHGGEILAEGTLAEIARHPDSLTGRYLREGMSHPVNGIRRPLSAVPKTVRGKTAADWLIVKKPVFRNLKGDDLRLPLNRLTMLCGVSGAGKSTLARDLLLPALSTAIRKGESRLRGSDFARENIGEMFQPGGLPPFAELINGHGFRKVIEVDQSPIGKTPRSTPATYLGIFDIIRGIYATLPEARARGFKPGRFSFNTAGGRCETCQGAGRIRLEMNFLPATFLPCEDCGGGRYGEELRDICWNGKSIGDVLNLTFEEAADFFDFHTGLKESCQLMVDTGLGYLKLGQSSPTLSGGEAQRLKLVTELMRGLPGFQERNRGIRHRHFFLLEEPTIGLHFRDCERLIHLLHRLVDQGHTVVVIEHNTDLLAEADYLVEIGPGGGDRGGRILYQGNFDGILNQKNSPTAPYLRNGNRGTKAAP